MKFNPLLFMLLPMLKLTALASQSLLFRKTAGKCSMNARSIDTKVFGHGLRSSCLFSSLSVDSDSLASGGKIGSDDEDALALATKKAEKSFKGLTRMRLRKALKTAQSDTDLLAEKALVKPRDVFEKIDYSSAYEPAPDISFDNEFSRLGLVTDVVKGLANQGFHTPTPVQKAVIPRLLNGENLVMAASTGSGKTLAFTLPVIQTLISQEQQGYERQIRRPRCIILVPTRDLARQILGAIKDLSHFSKISSCAILGGEQYTIQKKALNRLVDVIVASPGRLMQHKEQGNLYLSQVTHVIIDEVDTMLTQGFGSDIRGILRSVVKRNTDDLPGDHSEDSNSEKKVQLIMSTATLTKAVRLLLNDVQGGFNIEYSDPSNLTPKKVKTQMGKKEIDEGRVAMNIVEVDGVHRTLPNVRHLAEDTKGVDKLIVLNNIIARHTLKKYRTLVFCNTVKSCRAVEYAMTSTGIDVLSYHGDLNSKERQDNLEKFREGEQQFLVCTDLAARGLDIPEIDHVIMFDFPLNPVDYIHRAGRCGRAGRKGLVTAIIAKRDKILSDAIQGAVARGLPIDNLTSEKRDYQDSGKLASTVGRSTRSEVETRKASKLAALRPRFGSVGGGVKTGSGGKNDGGRGVPAGRGGGRSGTWSSGSSSSGYADRGAGGGRGSLVKGRNDSKATRGNEPKGEDREWANSTPSAGRGGSGSGRGAPSRSSAGRGPGAGPGRGGAGRGAGRGGSVLRRPVSK